MPLVLTCQRLKDVIMDPTTSPNDTDRQWVVTDLNDTFLAEIDAVLNTLFLTVAVVGIMDCVLGVALNLFLLLALLTSRALRADVRNLLIASLALNDLLVDAFCQPLFVADALGKEWVGGCHLHIAVQVLHICSSLFVSVYVIACLDALLLVRLTRVTSPLTSFMTSSMTTSVSVWRRRVERGVKVVVLVSPWVVSLVVILPLMLTGLHRTFVSWAWSDVRCDLILDPGVNRLIVGVFSFLPCGLIVLFLTAVGCVHVALRRRTGLSSSVPRSPPSPVTIATFDTSSVASSQAGDESPGASGPVSAYVAASALTVVLTCANLVYQLGDLGEDISTVAGILVYLSLSSISNLKSTVLPLVWLLMLPDVRARARHVLVLGRDTLRRVPTLPPAFDASVAYRNLPHD